MNPMVSENGKINRRQLLQALGLTAGAASVAGSVAYAQEEGVPRMRWMRPSYPRSGPFKTLSVGHISYSVPDQKKTRAWYIDLLGMQGVFDNGSTTALRFGIPWNLIYLGQNSDPNAKPTIRHMAYSIEKFRLDAVEAELKARGLVASYDGPEMIHTDDPEGYRLQPSFTRGSIPRGWQRAAGRRSRARRWSQSRLASSPQTHLRRIPSERYESHFSQLCRLR